MDTELFELCREVYKRTRWEGIGSFWMWVEAHHSYEADNGDYMNKDNPPVALYNSDYLLEKLQLKRGWKHGRLDLSHCYDIKKGFYWTASYNSIDPDFPIKEADTPLKALLKLTIALHEAGELK